LKAALWVIVVMGILFYTSKPKIAFSPFKITFESPLMPFAILFLVAALCLFGLHYQNVGFKNGTESMSKAVKENFDLTKKK